MSRFKTHIKKNDQVLVISGEDRGKKGRVLEVYPEKQRALVEGVMMISRHTKPNAKSPDGGIVKKEGPIHISNLKLAEAKTAKAATKTAKKEPAGKKTKKSEATK